MRAFERIYANMWQWGRKGGQIGWKNCMVSCCKNLPWNMPLPFVWTTAGISVVGHLYHFYEPVFSRTKACNGSLMWESCLMKLCSGTSLAISPIIASYIIPSRATIGGSGGNERYLAAARTPIGELKWNKAAESPAGSWPAPAHLFGSHRWLSPRTTTRPTNQVWS